MTSKTICCRRCNRDYPIATFTRPRRTNNPLVLGTFRQCNHCFEKRLNPKKPIAAGALIEWDIDHITNVECEQGSLADAVMEAFGEAEVSDDAVIMQVTAQLDLFLLQEAGLSSEESGILQLTTEHNKLCYDYLKRYIKPAIECGSGYYWDIRNVNVMKSHCATATLWCSSRVDRLYVSTASASNASGRPKKKCRRTPRFPCLGAITIKLDLSSKSVRLFCQHHLHHEKPTYRGNSFSQIALDHLKTIVESNTSKPELYRILCGQGLIDPTKVTRPQVSSMVSRLLTDSYLTDMDNQLRSASSLITSDAFRRKGFKQILFESGDEFSAFSFTTPFFKAPSRIKEIVIDSTFTINALRFQLFVVNHNKGGMGLPLVYLFYTRKGNEKSVNETDLIRKNVLTSWMSILCEKGLKPVFSVTANDAGQIAALQSSFPLGHVQLCLKHAQGVVESRLMSLGRPIEPYDADGAHSVFSFISNEWKASDNAFQGHIIPPGVKREFLLMFTTHYNVHPLIPTPSGVFLSAEEHHRQAVEKVYFWCFEKKLVHFWSYVWNEWYRPEKWRLFSRSAKPRLICLARTTNITESHWQKLKYDYKYSSNRPPLDTLTKILAGHLVKDMENQFEQISKGRLYPSWWHSFKQSWKKLQKKSTAEKKNKVDISDTKHAYYLEDWVCSCPTFLDDPYLLCKHLVRSHTKTCPRLPRFENTARRYDRPFYKFDVENSVSFVNLMHVDCDPWLPRDEIDTTASDNHDVSNDNHIDVSDDGNLDFTNDVSDDDTALVSSSRDIHVSSDTVHVVSNRDMHVSSDTLHVVSSTDMHVSSEFMLLDMQRTMEEVYDLIRREGSNAVFLQRLQHSWLPFKQNVGECTRALSSTRPHQRGGPADFMG